MVNPNNTGTPAASRKFFLFASVLVCLALLFSSDLIAQSDEWNRLYQEALSLREEGDYKRATEVAQRALELGERELGPNHPDVAQSLNNLAELYRAQGQYAQAEPLYKQALAMRQKSLGPDQPSLATSLNSFVKTRVRATSFAEY
jgi:tetratricopeptide (TPR) repeat protein